MLSPPSQSKQPRQPRNSLNAFLELRRVARDERTTWSGCERIEWATQQGEILGWQWDGDCVEAGGGHVQVIHRRDFLTSVSIGRLSTDCIRTSAITMTYFNILYYQITEEERTLSPPSIPSTTNSPPPLHSTQLLYNPITYHPTCQTPKTPPPLPSSAPAM